MFCPTNTNGSHDTGDEERLSQLIYENESLRMEMDTLKEQMESAGLLKVEEMKEEVETLYRQVGDLKAQLEAKTAQLNVAEQSVGRLQNIDNTLMEVSQQLQLQRDELSEQKLSLREKDEAIIRLTEQLDQQQALALEEKKKTDQLVSELRATLAATTEQKQQACASKEEAIMQRDEARLTVAKLEKEVLDFRKRTEEQILERKKMQEEVEAFHQREVAAQQQVVDLTSQCTSLMGQLETMCQSGNKYRAAAVGVSEAPTAFSPQQSNATHDIEQNKVIASMEKLSNQQHAQDLQSSILIAQAASPKSERVAQVDDKSCVSLDDENMDYRSKRHTARNRMEQRVADLLSSNALRREEVEQLLQQMLDYQEEMEQEMLSQLLVKDLRAEETEKTFRWNMKRLENENQSLWRQLQLASHHGVRDSDPSEQSARIGPPVELNCETPPRNVTVMAGESNDNSPQAIPPVRHPPCATAAPSQGSMLDDLWVRTPSEGTRHQERETIPLQPLPPHPHHCDPTTQSTNSYSPPPPIFTETANNTSIMVCCPKCTFEQKYCNSRCELCSTTLRLH